MKQAPQVWYIHIDYYFAGNRFHRCPYEHTLYIKINPGGNILTVYFHMDDSIFIGNNSKTIFEFRKVMISHFEIIELGLMSYFLGIEVFQTDDVIFIT